MLRSTLLAIPVIVLLSSGCSCFRKPQADNDECINPRETLIASAKATVQVKVGPLNGEVGPTVQYQTISESMQRTAWVTYSACVKLRKKEITEDAYEKLLEAAAFPAAYLETHVSEEDLAKLKAAGYTLNADVLAKLGIGIDQQKKIQSDAEKATWDNFSKTQRLVDEFYSRLAQQEITSEEAARIAFLLRKISIIENTLESISISLADLAKSREQRQSFPYKPQAAPPSIFSFPTNYFSDTLVDVSPNSRYFAPLASNDPGVCATRKPRKHILRANPSKASKTGHIRNTFSDCH